MPKNPKQTNQTKGKKTTLIFFFFCSHLTFLVKAKVLELNLNSLKAKLLLKEMLPSTLSKQKLLKYSQ